ncbi:protein-L-isoaspartate O-methyltransferase [Candidatus Dojkabacteria bacterium]|nr:protein-L-isoaspartate O-methyltransferase [Candidatus Dojkabacteria bacterium]
MKQTNFYNQYSWTRQHLNDVILHGKHKIISNKLLSQAFKNIDRADFVPEDQRKFAYNDTEIDIGFGQKLDKPTLIAEQLDLLSPQKNGRYLDLGAGSGYTAAILGEIVKNKGKVFALERILYLVEQMRSNLSKYKDLTNTVEILFKDGSKGYPDMAPYDGIISSVAFKQIPPELIKQLKIGGKLVIPTHELELKAVTRVDKDNTKEEIHHGYVFDKAKSGVE